MAASDALADADRAVDLGVDELAFTSEGAREADDRDVGNEFRGSGPGAVERTAVPPGRRRPRVAHLQDHTIVEWKPHEVLEALASSGFIAMRNLSAPTITAAFSIVSGQRTMGQGIGRRVQGPDGVSERSPHHQRDRTRASAVRDHDRTLR